jgi:hypothetical protein
MRYLCLTLLLAGCGDSDGMKTTPDMAIAVTDDLAVAPGADLARVEDLAHEQGDLTLADLATVDMAMKPDQAMAPAHKRIFVTSGTFNGNLGGLTGADGLCGTAAASLGGSWKAWLSDGTHDAIDRITDVGPWYLVNGTKVFDNKAALTGNPLVAIDVTENNTAAGGAAALPWTGTNSGGTKNGSTCTNWTDGAAGNGECGSAASATSTWTANSALPCSIPYSLYCLEQ